jgi:tetratricopeptide (TPR) repeat protein
MELVPHERPWGPVRSLWAALPRHPNILEPVASPDPQTLLLRYAAIYWNLDPEQVTRRVLATWGLQLLDALRCVLSLVGETQIGYFMNAFAKVDVGAHVRLGFLPLSADSPRLAKLPRQLRRAWPAVGTNGVMYMVGGLMRQLAIGPPDRKVARIARRCCEVTRRGPYKNLDQLAAALRALGGSITPVRAGSTLAGWHHCEEGLGWLALGYYDRADDSFRLAQATGAYRPISRWGRDQADPRRRPGAEVEVNQPLTAWRSWSDVEAEGLRLEAEREFAAALSVYYTVDPYSSSVPFLRARARCHLQVGELGEALEYATRAFRLEATSVEACDVLTNVLLQRRSFDEALATVEQLLALDPQRGRSHYLRGKALFGLGRMTDARDALERASQLDATLLEAQLLRREVERAIGNVRQSVGSQHAPTFDIPAQLTELRDVLISGDTTAAITALRDTRYGRDADAQLLLARFLAFDARFDEAIEVYGQLEATSHRTAALVGKAAALLELDRPGDALSILEQLPDDADAAEGQARALETLGRVDEAAEAYRRFIALASSGSDLRVRAAQLALDDIAARRRG